LGERALGDELLGKQANGVALEHRFNLFGGAVHAVVVRAGVRT